MGQKSQISSTARWVTTVLSIIIILVVFGLDRGEYFGVGFRNSIPPIITLLVILIIWCWKDYLDIYEIGPGGVKSPIIRDSQPTAEELKNDKVEGVDKIKMDLEKITKDKKDLEDDIKKKILSGYEGKEGAITVEKTAEGLCVPQLIAKNALESLYFEGQLEITKLPTDYDKRIYIHKSNLINRKINEAELKISENENVCNVYKFFSIQNLNNGSLVGIDAVIETEKNLYVIQIQRHESIEELKEIAVMKRELIIKAYRIRPQKPIKAYIVLTTRGEVPLDKIKMSADIIIVDMTKI